MKSTPNQAQNLRTVKRQKGVTLLEYAIIAALIAAVSIAIISSIGGQVNNVFNNINNQLQTGSGG